MPIIGIVFHSRKDNLKSEDRTKFVFLAFVYHQAVLNCYRSRQ